MVISIGRWCSMSFVMVSGPGAVDFFRRLMEEVNSCCVNGLLILELLFFVGFCDFHSSSFFTFICRNSGV